MEFQQKLNLKVNFKSKLRLHKFVGKNLSSISKGSNKPIFQIFGDMTILRWTSDMFVFGIQFIEFIDIS